MNEEAALAAARREFDLGRAYAAPHVREIAILHLALFMFATETIATICATLRRAVAERGAPGEAQQP